MKIGKFKKIAAIGLALTMAIGLLYTSGTVNAVDSTNPSVNSGIDNENVVTNKTAEYISEGENVGKYKIRLEAYAKGKVQTGVAKDLDIVLVLDQSGSMAYNFDGDRTWVDEEKRQYAMKQAVNNFIDDVYENSTGLTSETRVGVVTFGTNSDVLNSLISIKNYSNYQQLKANINGLPDSPSGATNVAAGMDSAQDMLSASNGREKVVIVFTDGVPTEERDFDISVANNAIATAKSMKDTNTKIYSVGIFYGANPEQLYGPTKHSLGWFEINEEPCTGEVGSKWNTSLDSSWFSDVTEQDIPAGNRFLNYISSNFDNTTEIGIVREDDTILEVGFFGYTITKNFERSSSDFYKTADNANELNNIFEQISEDISSSSIDLGSEAIMTDTLSDYFEFSKNKIECWTETYNANNKWTKDSSTTGIISNKNGNKLDVTGFDYSANYVLEEDVDGKPTGKRLVVEFYVEPKDGFIGGNAVPTNNLSQSGIFLENQTVENFPYPKVDVDINYNAMFNDAAMYAGDDWKDFYRFFNEIDKGIQYSIGSGNYTIDGSNNKYVDIEYQITDGSDVIATYTINAGKTEFDKNISIKDSYLQKVQKFDNDHNYTISVNVKPSEEAIDDDLDKITIDEYQTQNHNKTLYLYVPHIETNDKKVMVDTKVDFNNDEIINLAGWYSKTKDDNLPDPSYNGKLNDAPNLNYTIKGPVTNSGSEYPNIETFTPTKDGKYIFEYIVNNARNSDEMIDITDVSQHQNSCNIEPSCGKDDGNMFAIHVISGKITVIKNINESELEVNPTDGDPIFTFKLEKIANGKPVNTIYKTIKVNETNGQWTAQFDFDSLGEGTYKVTELETMRYEQISVTNNGQVTIDVEHLDHEIEFTNKVKSDDYFTDNDIVVNKFVIGDDGQMTVEKDYLN